MTTVANTTENNAKVAALKKIAETKFHGNSVLASLEECIIALNLTTTNSGWYNPAAVRINGLNGFYMLNEDGSLFCEARVIKEDEKKFRIEYMTNAGWREFEKRYSELLDN